MSIAGVNTPPGLPEPTDAQVAGWPVIQQGGDVLIAAPTGSGKTLAAFLAGIDRLIREAEAGTLPSTTQIVYVSPLKALGNDIQRNLESPLAEESTNLADPLWGKGFDLDYEAEVAARLGVGA